jgi:HEAT repeats
MTAVLSRSSGAWLPYAAVPAKGDAARVIELAEHRAANETRRNRLVPPPFDRLDSELAYDVSDRWREPCEAAFEYIVARSPKQLATLISAQTLSPGDLTFAAEILGGCADSDLVRATLTPLLQHAEAVVREGAIYGLTRHQDSATINDLRRLAAEDALVE